jgi:DNA-binding LacI/PurR family transcriptional regulator
MGVSANLNDTFGIIIPEMSNSASEFGYSLMLNRLPKGEAEELAKNARLVCEQLIDLQVAGVVFMPLEMPAHLLGINAEIAAMFDRAGINVVLVDRDICPPAKRSKYDIVAIDHEKAAYMLTLHLVDIGWKKIDFVSYQFSSASMIQRFNGYQNALRESGLAYDKSRLHIIEDTKNVDAIRKTVRELDTDALVCVNDEIAVMMMNQMSQCGIQVPRDMRIVGFDDSPILTHFHLPLTTVRQPVRELGDEAIRALLFRKANPAGPARTTMLATQLIVRDSCGSKMFGKK